MAADAATGSSGPSIVGDQRPKVSVIVIFLDAEQFIGEAVESVFAQTFSDWELLLVDDGSTDGSTQIARGYAAARPERVRYLEHAGHANRGMSASRNAGLAAARGAYVAFLDADDVYLPQRLERHVEILDAMSFVDMVQSDCVKWHSWAAAGRRIDDDVVWPFPCVGDRVLRPPEGLLTSLALRDVYVGICSITVRRDAALAVGGFEEEFRSFYEDEVFLSKIYLNRVVYALNEYLARYRIHPASACGQVESTSHLSAGSSRLAGRKFHAWLSDYLRSTAGEHEPLKHLIDAIGANDAVERARPLAIQAGEVAASVRRSADRMLRMVLPAFVYVALHRWRRRVAIQRLSRRYEALCRQLSVRELRLVAETSEPSSR